MQNATHPTSSDAPAVVLTPDLREAEVLGNNLRHLLVRSEKELIVGEVHEYVEQLERWVESYRRGLSAAQKISNNGADMLQKTRDKIGLALEELLRLEDEGGNPPANSKQAAQIEYLTSALQRIDRIIPAFEQSFNTAQTPENLQNVQKH